MENTYFHKKYYVHNNLGEQKRGLTSSERR